MPGDTERDELSVLTALRADHGPVFLRRPGEIWVADPLVAKDVLGNASGLYREHSDFFQTRHGLFGPRSAQTEIGKAARALLRAHADGVREAAQRIPSVSRWPDTANLLMYEHFRHVLIRPSAPPTLRHLVDDVVRHAVLAGARERRSPVARAALRTRVTRGLAAEICARRGDAAGDDILGVVARLCPERPSRRELAQLTEVFLSCLFAVAGSVGFLLAWSVYLLGTGYVPDAPPDLVVREALRLWPVAWLFGRTPAVAHTVGGIRVTPRDEVLVCGYLVQRDGRYWDAPDEFRPGRWAGVERGQREAFIPFGWGPHACTGATLAMTAAQDVLAGMTARYRIKVETHGDRPHVAAALAPPPFTLRLSPLARERR